VVGGGGRAVIPSIILHIYTSIILHIPSTILHDKKKMHLYHTKRTSRLETSNAHPYFLVEHELSSAIFPAETRSCLKLTSALYHSMIVVGFAGKYFNVNVRCVRSIYSLSCVVVIRFGLQKPVRVSYVLRFFLTWLTKQQTFSRSSLLYTIQYNVVMNEF
jgi:hypothetical protein